jgi:5-methylcytosine-specific restriction endonuclease McrA
MKINREDVYNKCNGHCAYCGKEITFKQMQVDHVISKSRFYNQNPLPDYHHNELKNLLPSCARCNKWKDTFTIDGFRTQIELQLERLRRDSPNYRIALDYNLIEECPKNIIFYFEKNLEN